MQKETERFPMKGIFKVVVRKNGEVMRSTKTTTSS